MPYAGIDLAVYETLKALYVKRYSDVSEPGVLALLACGTCSSTCGQCVSYPLALIRTRLQARSEWWEGRSGHCTPSISAISNDKFQPDTMIGQLKYILHNEGPTGLYRGIAPNFMKVRTFLSFRPVRSCLQVIPAVSISYVVYESVRKQLGARMT